MYVIAGVSGNTGKVVADTLLAKGERVRVVVRDAAKAAAFAARGAEVAVADLSDADALTAALKGAKGAYLLVPPNMAAVDFYAYQAEVVAALAKAITAASVPHVVFLSSIGADKPSGTGPIAGLHGAEKALSSIAGTRTTFLRASYFMENLGGSLGALAHGVFPSFTPAAFAYPMVATKDIGALAAERLLKGAEHTEVINLGGPERSASDVALVLSELTGKTVNVAEAPVASMGATLQSYGVPATMAGLYQEMTEAMVSGHIAFDATLPRVTPTTALREVLSGML